MINSLPNLTVPVKSVRAVPIVLKNSEILLAICLSPKTSFDCFTKPFIVSTNSPNLSERVTRLAAIPNIEPAFNPSKISSNVTLSLSHVKPSFRPPDKEEAKVLITLRTFVKIFFAVKTVSEKPFQPEDNTDKTLTTPCDTAVNTSDFLAASSISTRKSPIAAVISNKLDVKTENPVDEPNCLNPLAIAITDCFPRSKIAKTPLAVLPILSRVFSEGIKFLENLSIDSVIEYNFSPVIGGNTSSKDSFTLPTISESPLNAFDKAFIRCSRPESFVIFLAYSSMSIEPFLIPSSKAIKDAA